MSARTWSRCGTPHPAALAALMLCLLIPVTASADGFYLGAGAYMTDLEFAALDGDDFTPAAFVGFQFLDTPLLMASVELGYYDLGTIGGRVDELRFSADVSALSLAGVAYLPLGPFIEVYAKAGAASVELDTRFGDLVDNDDRTEFFGGVGLAWDIFDTVDIYMEYLRFDTEVDSQMAGIGIRLDLF